jgi:hypothetical protein
MPTATIAVVPITTIAIDVVIMLLPFDVICAYPLLICARSVSPPRDSKGYDQKHHTLGSWPLHRVSGSPGWLGRASNALVVSKEERSGYFRALPIAPFYIPLCNSRYFLLTLPASCLEGISGKPLLRVVD